MNLANPKTEPATTDKPKDQISWRTRLQALRNVAPMLRLLWETSRLLVLSTIFLRLCRSLLPVTGLWISKLIMDALVARIMHRSGDAMHIWKLIALQFLFAIC